MALIQYYLIVPIPSPYLQLECNLLTSVSLPWILAPLSLSTTTVVIVTVYYNSGLRWTTTPNIHTLSSAFLPCFPLCTIRVYLIIKCSGSDTVPAASLSIENFRFWPCVSSELQCKTLGSSAVDRAAYLSSQCPNSVQPPADTQVEWATGETISKISKTKLSSWAHVAEL